MLSLNNDIKSDIIIRNHNHDEKILPFYQIHCNGKLVKAINFWDDINVVRYRFFLKRDGKTIKVSGVAYHHVFIFFDGENEENIASVELICSVSDLNQKWVGNEYTFDLSSEEVYNSFFNIFKGTIGNTPIKKEWDNVGKWIDVINNLHINESNNNNFGRSVGYEIFQDASFSINETLLKYGDLQNHKIGKLGKKRLSMLKEIFQLYYYVMDDEYRNILFTVNRIL